MLLQQSEEENADEEFDFRPAGGEEDQSEQFMSRCDHLKRQKDKKTKRQKDKNPKRQKKYKKSKKTKRQRDKKTKRQKRLKR